MKKIFIILVLLSQQLDASAPPIALPWDISDEQTFSAICDAQDLSEMNRFLTYTASEKNEDFLFAVLGKLAHLRADVQKSKESRFYMKVCQSLVDRVITAPGYTYAALESTIKEINLKWPVHTIDFLYQLKHARDRTQEDDERSTIDFYGCPYKMYATVKSCKDCGVNLFHMAFPYSCKHRYCARCTLKEITKKNIKRWQCPHCLQDRKSKQRKNERSALLSPE